MKYQALHRETFLLLVHKYINPQLMILEIPAHSILIFIGKFHGIDLIKKI